MSYDARSLDDYIDVAQRIADFRERYPEGTLQPADPAKPWELAIVSGTKKDGEATTQTFIVYTAAAYRTPGDTRPGIGVAWEIWPGRTPYTLGSELMNAETSAWGRAIIAVGASDSKRSVRSREEMEARESERAWGAWAGPEPASDDCLNGRHCGACTGCRCHCHSGLPVNKDGTLSLSKMSDEQRLEAGQMTRAQAKEHAALRPSKREGTGQRATATADDDPFYDHAGDPLPGVPRSGIRSSMAKMFLRYAQLGITDDAEMRADIGRILGREVVSRSSLTLTEVTEVNKVLLGRLAEGGEAK